jgi:hypothetical protein
MTVDGQPAVRTCTTASDDGMRVARSGGWPSAERDLLRVTDSLHRVIQRDILSPVVEAKLNGNAGLKVPIPTHPL